MVLFTPSTVCVPPLFMGAIASTPFFCIHMHSSKMPTTVDLCCLAIFTASAMWSKCPCVQINKSAFFTSFSPCGHSGFSITQGSTYTVLPSAVSMRNVECPSQVKRFPCRFIIPSCFGRNDCLYLAALRLHPTAISAGQRDHVVESHAFEAERGQGRAEASRAIQHDLTVLIGRHLIDVSFQDSAWHRDRARDGALGVLVRLAHVDQREIFAGLLHPRKFFRTDFLDLALRLIHNLFELGQWHSRSPALRFRQRGDCLLY